MGACNVQINGKPARSCLLPIGSTGDRMIITIERIGATEIQKAGLDLEVVQRRSSCQPGQIVSADVLNELVAAREKAEALKAELFNKESAEACRWPNARTGVAPFG